MTNHTDIKSIELIISQLPFIKSHYNCLLVECVPNSLNNESLLTYLRNIMLTYTLNLTAVQNELNIADKYISALCNKYSENISDKEKMQLKYEAVKIIREQIQLPGNINQVFYQFFYYHYLSEALKLGLNLFGVEDNGYRPGQGIHQLNRDQEIVNNTMKLTLANQNCFMMVGASHGVDLIKSFQKCQIIKNSYTHLYCENSVINQNSKGYLFKTEIESGNGNLTDMQTYIFLDISQKSNEEQIKIFHERIVTAESEELVYHQYGKSSYSKGSSFSVSLSKLTGLYFFTTMDDKNYVADAVCVMKDLDQKSKAMNVQQQTGLGSFFKTDSGVEVFAIQDTNGGERLDLMQNSLNKLRV